jgi:hypothetical protein
MSDQRHILTIATGKKLYVDLALNLARSFFFWNRDTDIKFQLVTDQQEHVPADIRSKIQIINIKPGELGEGFSPKLFLDRIASEGKTLFIDSDCLIFGDLSRVFEAFKGRKVSVIGDYISEGEWFGDIKKICERFSVPHLPKFNGGIYYLEKGETASAVYETARGLESSYDEIGFIRLRNKPNDEVLMALAMQLHGQQPIPDDSTIMSDPQACPGGYAIDVIKGERWLLNPSAPDPKHQSWYPFQKVSPVVFHFLGYYTQHYPYRREVYRLEKALVNNLNWFSNLKSLIVIEYPERLKVFLKNTLRSTYHKLFGVRKIKPSERVTS